MPPGENESASCGKSRSIGSRIFRHRFATGEGRPVRRKPCGRIARKSPSHLRYRRSVPLCLIVAAENNERDGNFHEDRAIGGRAPRCDRSLYCAARGQALPDRLRGADASRHSRRRPHRAQRLRARQGAGAARQDPRPPSCPGSGRPSPRKRGARAPRIGAKHDARTDSGAGGCGTEDARPGQARASGISRNRSVSLVSSPAAVMSACAWPR